MPLDLGLQIAILLLIAIMPEIVREAIYLGPRLVRGILTWRGGLQTLLWIAPLVVFGWFWEVRIWHFSLATFVQVITISSIIFVPLIAFGTQPSRWAVAGIVVYTASFFISNAWRLAYYLVDPWSPEIAEAITAIGAPASPVGFAIRLYTLGLLLLVPVMSGMVFFALDKNDVKTRAIWIIETAAEGWAVWEYLRCKVFTDPWGAEDLYLAATWGEKALSVCARETGFMSAMIGPLVSAIFMIWAVTKVGRHDNRPTKGG